MTTIKLTERQAQAISRLARGVTNTVSPDLARQLERKGLVIVSMNDYHRYEWNRIVATLKRVTLTEEGKAAYEAMSK